MPVCLLSLLLQAEVRSVVVVVADVFSHEPLEVPLVEHNDMIDQVSAAVAYKALGDAVLPGTTEGGPLGLNAKPFDGADDSRTEVEHGAVLSDNTLRKSGYQT